MWRDRWALFIALPIGTFTAYLLARGLLNESWQKFIYAENGPIELGTASFFALAAVGAVTLCGSRPQIPRIIACLFGCYALLCTFIALEEISYGQQFFGWQSPEWFEEHNHHHQTNLHNLMGNRPSHVLKHVGAYGTMAGFIVLPVIATRFARAYQNGHWTYYLLPRLELVVTTGCSAICSFLWDSQKSTLGDYWHQGWNELRELYWGMAAISYVLVMRRRLFGTEPTSRTISLNPTQVPTTNAAA